MSTWTPVVTEPAARAEVARVIREVAAAVTAVPLDDVESLVDRAVMRAYLAQDGTFPDDSNDGAEDLARAVGLAVERGIGPELATGLARVGWATCQLAADADADTVCAPIDRHLIELLDDRWDGDHDLLTGLVGFGVYAFERGDEQLGRLVLEHLERRAQPIAGGLAWPTPPHRLPAWQRARSPEGHCDLGFAHGALGVIALLARMVANDFETTRARELLGGAVAYVRAKRVDGRFLRWDPPDNSRPPPGLAWCYGDLGAAIALTAAARATDDAVWLAEAHALAVECARRAATDAGIRDAGLCHGGAGAAHGFMWLWHATGNPALADAARAWVSHTLAFRNAEPIAGFPSALVDLDGRPASPPWRADPTLLLGAAGVALVLHAAISTVAPAWDRAVVVDLPVA